MHLAIQLSQKHLLRLFFLYRTLLAPCCKSVDYICKIYFRTLNSVSLVYTFVFTPVSSCFDYCSFLMNFEIAKYESSHFILFQGCSDNIPCISIYVLGSLCPFLWKNQLEFDRDCKESVDPFGECRYLNNIMSSDSRPRDIFVSKPFS